MTDSLLGLFDKDKSGEICFSEFGALWRYVVDWQNCFKAFDKYLHFLTCRVLKIYACKAPDLRKKKWKIRGVFRRDKSGTINQSELQEALTTFGYNLSPQVHKQQSPGSSPENLCAFVWSVVYSGVFLGVPSSATQVWQNRSKRCVLRRLHPVLSCHAGSLLFGNQWKEEA